MFDMKEYKAKQAERRNGLVFWRKFRDEIVTVEELHRHLMNIQSQAALVDMLDDMTSDEVATFMIMAFSELSGLTQHQMKANDSEVSFWVDINGKEYYTTCSASDFDECNAVKIAADFHLAGGVYSGHLLAIRYPDGTFIDYADES